MRATGRSACTLAGADRSFGAIDPSAPGRPELSARIRALQTRDSIARGEFARFTLGAIRCGGSAVALGLAALGQAVVFQDGDFNDVEWTHTILTTAPAGAAVSAHQSSSGGAPGAFRAVALTVPGGAYSHVLSFHSRSGAVLDPSNYGGVSAVDFSIDYICFGSCGTATGCRQTGVALRQSGQVFIVPGCQATTANSNWTGCDATGLSAAAFQRVNPNSGASNVILDSSVHPDFSCSAPPIELGFYVWGAGGAAGSGACQTSSGYDNWIVTAHTYAPSAYCTSGLSTTGCRPTIGASGGASASAASGFTVTASGVDGQRQGLLFYGVSGPTASPWGAQSFLCVKAPTQRTAPHSSGGTSGACDGALALDWNAWRAAHPSALGQSFAAGDSIWLQGWFRDPASSKTTALSNALEARLCP